jgi:transcriptional regulator GlxA family with amidase domain
MISVEQSVAPVSIPSRQGYLFPDRQIMLEVTALLDHARQALGQDVRLAGLHICNAVELLRSDRERRKQDATGMSPGRLAPWQLRSVTEYMHNDLSRTLRVKDLAAAARLSVSHFSRAFHHTAGEPPARYLRRCRVEQAQKMMLATDRCLADIALECGYTDQAHLSRTFRAVVGCSPARWRRLQRRGIEHSSSPGSGVSALSV